jgi:hypothetical protein
MSKIAINLFTSSCLENLNVLVCSNLSALSFLFVIYFSRNPCFPVLLTEQWLERQGEARGVIEPIPNLFWILTNTSVS